MATNRAQRQYDRSPRSGRSAPARILVPSLAILLAALAAILVLLSTGGRREAVSHEPPAFLRASLGAPAPGARAELVRRAPGGLTARVHRGGYTLEQHGASLTLSSAGPSTAPWRRFRNGTARTTSFGGEAITLDGPQAEGFLTVGRHTGPRTWRWRVDAGTLEPSLRASGVVDFHVAGAPSAGFRVLPVRILDGRGRDVTPAGLRWRLERDAKGLLLALDLDDRKLPVPYVIDPAAITLNGTPSTASNGSGSTSLTINTPSGVAADDLLLAQITVGGGSGATITPPTGWTILRRDNQSTNVAQAIYWHVAASGDPTSYTWSFGATSRAASGGMVGYAGVQNPAPLQTMAGIAGPTTTTSPYAPSVTTTADKALTVVFFGQPTASTWSAPAGMTLRYQTTSAATGSMVADAVESPAGATGTRTASASTGSTWIGQQLALDLDTTPPTTPTVTVSTSATAAYSSGTTLWYRPSGSGSLTIGASSGDAESGFDRLEFPALPGFNPFSVGIVNATSGSRTYTWNGAGTASGAQTVSAYDRAGNVSTATFTMTPDSTPPTGQTITLTGGTTTSTLSVGFTTADGSDAGVGLDTASRLVERASATLSNGVCGTFGAFSGSYASPDTTVASGNCYQYRFSVADRVGNRSAYVATAAVKVDTSAPSAPAPTLTESPASGAQHVSGTTLYYRPGGAGGTFGVSAAPADAQSGIASVAFPAIAGLTGGGTVAASPYTTSYTWSAATAATGAQTITATNGTGLTSTATFSLVQDSTAPAGGSVSYPSGWSSGSVAIATAGGTDSGSGVDAASGVLERQTAPLSGGTCGTYGAWSAVTSPDTVPDATCAVYRYRISDNVGNTATYTSAGVVKVDATAPAAPSLAFGSFTNASATGTAVYYRPGTSGSFTVTATGNDPQSGIVSTSYPALGSGWSGAGTYTWSGTPTPLAGGQPVTVTNGAGATSPAATFTVTPDSTAPSTTITCNGAPCNGGSYSGTVSVVLAASDAGSGVAAIRYTLDGTAPTAASPTYTAPLSLTTTTTVKWAALDTVGNLEAAGSQLVSFDSTPPTTPTLAFGSFTRASATGTTVWYRPGGAGGFTVTASASDPESGIASTSYPDLGAGWTRSVGTYSFGGTPTPPSGPQTVTVTNGVGLTSSTTFAVSPDTAAPAGGSVTYPGGWNTTGSVTVATADGSDADSGVDPASGILERQTATLAGGACGAYGAWSAVTSPDTLPGGTCAVYRYLVSDRVGNTATYTSAAVVKVDTTPPAAPALAFGSFTNAAASGQTVWYRPGVAGGFTATATGADPESGIASAAYPDLGAGWTRSGGAYSWSGTPAAPSGPQSVTVANGAGLVSPAATFTALADSTPPASAIACDGASCAGWHATTQVSLSATDGGSGVAAIRYTLDGSAPTALSPAYAAPFTLSATTTVKWAAVDSVGNVEATGTQLVQVDTTPPSAPVLAFSGFTRASATGTAVYYRPGGAGGFTVTASAADPESGVAATSYPALGTGWTGSGGAYSFGGTPAAPSGAQTVTVANGVGLTSSSTFTATPDSTGPAGGSVTYADGWNTTGTVAVATADGTDAGAGVDAASGVLERQTAALAGGVCGSYGAWSAATSPDTLPSGTCAVYRYRIGDAVGNTTTYTSASVVKVDTTAPAAPTLSFSGFTRASATGTTVWYRPGGAGGFTVAAAASDPESGVAATTFPALGGGWSGSGGAYSFSGTPAEPGAQAVTATNAAGLTSPGAAFAVSADATPPAGGSVSYADGWNTTGAVTVATATGGDAESGVDAATGTLQRRTAALAGGACGAYGAWSAASSPDTLPSGTCAQYRYLVSDRVGNVATYTSPNVVRVDTSAPAAPALAFGSFANASASGSTVWYRPAAAGGFTVAATGSDAESGIAATSYPDLGAGWTRSGGAYSWTAAPAEPAGAQSVTVTNAAGLVSPASGFSAVADAAAPTTTATCDGAACTSAWSPSPVTVALSAADAGSGVAAIRYTTDGSEPTALSPAYAAPFALSTRTTVKFAAVDAVGNVEPTATLDVRVDTTAPAAPTLAFSGETNAAASGSTVWYRPGVAGGFTVAATGADAESGIASTSYPALGAGWSGSGGVYAFDATAAAPGPNLPVTVRNGAGLDSPAATFAVRADATAPATSAACDGAACTGAWAAGDVAVTLAASDAESGVAAIRYTLDGSAPVAGSPAYSAPLAITATTTVRYAAVDAVGNVEAAATVQVRIDRTPPAAPSLALAAGANAAVAGSTVWYRAGAAGDFTVAATGADAESGIVSTSYPVLGAGWSGSGGVYAFDATAAEPGPGRPVTVRNGAGLDSPAASFAVLTDAAAPATSIACDGAACTGAWATSPVAVTLAAADGGSGVAAIRYTLDGSAPDASSATYSAPLTVSQTTTVRFAAVDRVGNVEAPGSQLVRVDTTPPAAPALAFSGLDNASAAGTTVWYRPSVAGTFTVAASSSDPQSGIASTTYPELGAGWARSGGAYSWSAAPAAPANPATVTVTNGAGLSSSTGFAPRPDSAAPATTIACDGAPCGGWSTVDSLVSLSASDADSGVAVLRYTLDGSEPTALSPVYTAPFTITGTTTVKWAAVDAVGNVEPTGTQVVRVDTSTPTVALASPAAGGALRATATLSVTAADAGSGLARVGYQLSADGGATWGEVAAATAAPWDAGWDTTPTPDGSYALRPVADDVAGNRTIGAARAFLVDNTPPLAAIDSPGATVNAPVTLTSTASDGGSGVASRTYEFTPAGTAGWQATPALWDTTALADGVYDLRVVVADAAGNRTVSAPVRTTLDATAPTGALTAPAAGALLRGGVAVAADSADATSGVASARFEVSADAGATWTTAATATAAPYGFTWNTAAVADGPWRLRVVTTDVAGNARTSAAVAVEVDNTPPAATMTSPGAAVAGTVALTATVSDGGTGIDTTTFEVSPSGAGQWTATPASWNTTGLADGPYDLRVVALDRAGNRTASAPQTTLVDNRAPTVAVASPTGMVNAAAADPLPVTASSADTDIARVEFFACSDGSARCSGGTWVSLGTDTTAPYSRGWPLPADGPVALRVVATDLAGNTGSDVVDVLVDRTAPAGGTIAYAGGFSAGAPVALTTDPGTDAGSGLAAGAATIERDSAALADGVCGAWAGAWATVSAPDATVAGGRCYRYRLRVEDRAGNVATFGSPAVVSVDTTPPTVTLALAESSPWSDASGTTLTTNPQGAHGGTFTVTATAADPESGVTSVAFPVVYGGDGAVVAAAPYARDYTWDATGGGVGPHAVTATNASGLSATADFTVAEDVAPPTGSTVSYADGYVTSASATVDTAAGTDAGSGLAPTGRLLERADAGLSGGACGAFGAFATVATDPAASFPDTTVASGGCYRYRYVVADRVGNVETATSAAVVRVDADAPAVALADPGALLRGSVALAATASDTGGSGVASVAFERSPAGAGTWTSAGSDTAAPYTLDLDTTAIADGVYDLRAVALDAAGNRTASALVASVRVDNTPPSVSLADPGTPLRATVALSAATSDAGSGLAGSGFEISPAGAGTWTAVAASWDTTLLADGLYDVRAYGVDAAGNRAVDTAAGRRVDNTPPTAAMTGLPAVVRGTLDLTADAADAGSGVASTTFEARPAGGAWAAVPARWDTRGAADGAWDVRAVVTDAAGNRTDSAPAATLVDNTAPTAVLTDPGSPVSGTVGLSSFTDDATSGVDTVAYEVRPSGGAWAPQAATWKTTLLDDGLYDLRVVVADRAGNQTIDTRAAIRVDNTVPQVALVSPADGSYANAASADPLLVQASAADPGGSGVASVELFQCSDTSAGCSTGVWASIGIDTTAPYTATWTLPGDGRRALRAVAIDGAGHAGTASVEVFVDRTAPTAALVDPGPWLARTVRLEAGAADGDGSGIGSVAFQRSPAGAATWTTIATDATAPYAADLDTTALPDGLYDLRVFVTDVAGNTTTAFVGSRRFDNTPPDAAMTDPGANLRGTATLASTAADVGGSGVATRTYEISPTGAGTWTVVAPDWDTTSVADGLYDVRVRVADRAGNETIAAPVEGVRVDNTPPTATMTPPDAAVRGTVTLTSATDDTGSGIATVRYEVSPAGAGTWTATPAAWATTALADGLYDLHVVATDVAGNVTTSAAVTGIRVDNTPPTVALADPGTNLRGTVTLSATADDPGGSGVATLVYEVAPTGTSTWAATPAALDTASLADGLYDLRAVATDVAGNRTASAPVVGVRIDNTAPTTTDDAPADVRSGAVGVTLSASDAGSGVARTEAAVDGGAYQTGTLVVIAAPADHTNDGEHVIRYRSVDVAGNVERARTAIVVIDTTPPGGSTTDPGATLRGRVTLSSDASASDIVSVTFQWARSGDTGADPWRTIDVDRDAPYSVVWDTTGVDDGSYDLRTVVVDRAGLESVSELPGKIVDNTAPTAAVTAPRAGRLVHGRVTLAATATDATSGVASVEFRVSTSAGAAFDSTDTTAPYSATWDTSAAPDGPAELTVVVRDVAGNETTSDPRAFALDNQPPVVELADPGAQVAGTVALSATASGDTEQVDFQRRPAGGDTWTTFATATAAPFAASMATAALGDGGYELRAVATDGSGNEGTSASRSVLVDNTAPDGNLTRPAAGDTVGGPNVELRADATDAGGSGVASVTFQERPGGATTWTDVAVDREAPYEATWDTTPVPSGGYRLRVLVADAAGNTAPGPGIAVTVDSTPPTVALSDPGPAIGGGVTLAASAGGAAPTQVSFERRPAGGGDWTQIGVARGAPWRTALDTTALGDGLYDLRAVVSDRFGNTAESVRAGVRVDNTPPRLVSSTPAEGAAAAAVDTVTLVANEPLSAVRDATLDGRTAPAAALSGSSAVFATGSLGTGAHSLGGTLVDGAGKGTPFLLHFVVGTDAGAVSWVEANASLDHQVVLALPDGSASVTIPAAVWNPGDATKPGDWLVFRLDGSPPAPALDGGFEAVGRVIDVTSRWALAGGEVHRFLRPLDVVIANPTGAPAVPATYDGGRWRALEELPGRDLPADRDDGFYRDGGVAHVLTRHLSLFGLLHDVEPPAPPSGFEGSVGDDGLTLRWVAGADNGGRPGQVVLYVNGSPYANFDTTQSEAKLGPIGADDTRRFSLAQLDGAGNSSARTAAIAVVPALDGTTVEEATALLAARGFAAGPVTQVASAAPAGTVVAPGVRVAFEGAAIGLEVSTGVPEASPQAPRPPAPAPPAPTAPTRAPQGPGPVPITRFGFSVVGTKRIEPAERRFLGARIKATQAARVTASLIAPRGRDVYRWRLRVVAGESVVRLRMPKAIRTAGLYRVAWTAQGPRELLRRTTRLRIESRLSLAEAAKRRRRPARVDVVVAGAGALQLPRTLRPGPRVRVTAARAIDGAWALTGSTSRNVEVVVVDVDTFGTRLVHDLRTVFPSVRVLAVGDDPVVLERAVRLGAAAAVPRTAPRRLERELTRVTAPPPAQLAVDPVRARVAARTVR